MAHFMAHSNILPPLDHSPESHASAWPVSAWDGRRQLRSNAEWVLHADACAQGDTPRGFGMPESGDLETEMTSHRAEARCTGAHDLSGSRRIVVNRFFQPELFPLHE